MLNHCIRNMANPMDDIKVDLGVDDPLHEYVQKAIQDLEIINILGLNPIDENSVTPFIKTCNWQWNPHPSAEEIQYRRRETKDKLLTKYTSDTRIGILSWDIYAGALDKNNNLETVYITGNKMYVPIEDKRGRYLIDNICYPQYQLVDKLLYPSGKNSITLKSLLPIVIKYHTATETSIDGYLATGDIGMVKIFTTMEPIISCFMHTAGPLQYLEVFPILQFCDEVSNDKEMYEYFKPNSDTEIYIKAYKPGLEKFGYVRSILVMFMELLRKHQPPTIGDLRDPKWWVYKLSYYEDAIAHRGACHQMHVARMLDTISAKVLPIPGVDKRNMISLLRYILQTEFDDINILSFENKRLRLNEVISTIITSEVSDKLKRMFKYGSQLKLKDLIPILNFRPQTILKKMHQLGTVKTIDFTNDLDYPQQLRFTRKGPNSLGRLDDNKIYLRHRQLHHSMIGTIDLLDISKDVGQSGTISPWADISDLSKVDVNKYPTVKFELWKFKEEHFPNKSIVFKAKDIVEYNRKLDIIAMSAYINIDVGKSTIV